MKSEIRLPTTFEEYLGEAIISNLDGLIKEEIETAIKNKPLFSRYTAWHFNALIWWNDQLGYWCAEVWVYQKYIASHLVETLQNLANEIDINYGKGEKISFT